MATLTINTGDKTWSMCGPLFKIDIDASNADQIEAALKKYKEESSGQSKSTLPDSFCVLHDGSEEFREVVIGWMNERSEPRDSFCGCFPDEYYGWNKNHTAYSCKPFGTLLTIAQFKEMIS